LAGEPANDHVDVGQGVAVGPVAEVRDVLVSSGQHLRRCRVVIGNEHDRTADRLVESTDPGAQ
jgi:hypothetical protein